MNKKAQAFTIVELLIVIVVIAILATISIAAYTNIQQRAKNTAIINAASQSLKMIQAYIAEYGTYPLASTSTEHACITSTVGCRDGSNTYNTNNTFDTNMAKIGTLPKSIPVEGDNSYGLRYMYNATVTFNGDPQPALLVYYLSGKNQQCGVPGVMRGTATSNVYLSSTTGYHSYNSGLDKTICYINIPGPAPL